MSIRSESLARLHNTAVQPQGFTVVEMMEAQAHGLAAVRAVRSVRLGECRYLDFSACMYRREPHGGEYLAARRAARAALNAVGIRGAL